MKSRKSQKKVFNDDELRENSAYCQSWKVKNNLMFEIY